MKEISWEDYYDKFYGWTASTQKNRAYGLTDYGPADEVFEVAQAFASGDEKFTARFINKALDAEVRFTPEQTVEMSMTITDKAALGRMAETAAPDFTREQLEEIYTLIDDEAFARISKRLGIEIFEDETAAFGGHEVYQEEKPAKIGFFTKLMAFIGAAGEIDTGAAHKHGGRCDGDCAHCPPHYGYRYGKWYYGHGHQYGCEFGGNKGGGGM